MVADGMGGHHAGEYASDAIAQSLAEVTMSADLSDFVDAIEDRLLEVNDHLRRHARSHLDGATVGSTVVAAVCRGQVGVVLWAGDSRLYRLRGRLLEQITRDHNPVADLLDSGGVTEAQALAADTHIITRAVGGQRELHLDVAIFDVCPGDSLLLCSDGLYREVELEEIAEALTLDVDVAAERLLMRCLQGPARDNVSLVVAHAEAAGV
jgi:protein phosphatase